MKEMKAVKKKDLILYALKLWKQYGEGYRCAIPEFKRLNKIRKEKNLCLTGERIRLTKEVVDNYPKIGFLDIVIEEEAKEFLERLEPVGIMLIIDSINKLNDNFYYRFVRSTNAAMRDLISRNDKKYPKCGMIDPSRCGKGRKVMLWRDDYSDEDYYKD